MRNRLFTAFAGVIAFATSVTPLCAQSREQRQMMAALQVLQEQAQQLALAVTTLQQSVDESVKALSGRIDDTNNALRKAAADQKLAIDNAAADIRVVRERSDDTNVRIAALREELEALRTTVLSLGSQPVPAPAPGVDGAGATPPPATPPPAASTAGLSPTRMLDTAKADYFQGQWTSAVNGFEAFLRAFPRSESAGEAQFFIGESFSAQSRWQDAIAAYNLVIQNYPLSNVVPDAYYKRGLAQERLGQIDAARASWELAIKSYPDSDAGRLARQNLDRLGARRP